MFHVSLREKKVTKIKRILTMENRFHVKKKLTSFEYIIHEKKKKTNNIIVHKKNVLHISRWMKFLRFFFCFI